MAMMKIIVIFLLSVLPFILGNEINLSNARLGVPKSETWGMTYTYWMRELTSMPSPLQEMRCFDVQQTDKIKKIVTKYNNDYRTNTLQGRTTLEGFLVFFIISALFVNIAFFYINTQRIKIIQRQIRTLTDMAQVKHTQDGGLRELESGTSQQN